MISICMGARNMASVAHDSMQRRVPPVVGPSLDDVSGVDDERILTGWEPDGHPLALRRATIVSYKHFQPT